MPARPAAKKSNSSAKLTIINRSSWPDFFVRPICEWIIDRAGITWDYTITLPRVASRSMFAGRAGKRRQRTRINRRFRPHDAKWPYLTKYWRYKWSPGYLLYCRLETFVDLVSHEACHATAGSPDKFIVNGRVNCARMEMTCERFSKATVEAFRIAWPDHLKAKVWKLARKHRREAKRRVVQKYDPSTKLLWAQQMLAKWVRQEKAAANRVKKYRRQCAYYQRQVTKHALRISNAPQPAPPPSPVQDAEVAGIAMAAMIAPTAGSAPA